MPRRTGRKKRKYLGGTTSGAGNRKNRRGKGSKGGRGRAGFHKHRWLHKIKTEGTKPPKGFSPIGPRAAEAVTLRAISEAIANGRYESKGGAYEVSLGKAAKVIGAAIGAKANVSAGAFSEKAKKAIEAAGGTAKALA